ncbi:helix-turn-helix domain-containing protein [Fusobacterium gastrosuis]|uniref:helix-turn-helix domain-containing protein n=1 Tax=Fusobacterium gastrosuis TaxID=1755100 RepID=UPI0029749544|nr:helix-turn-helix transcriptional regulator [Fusobacteriaceae bacterium]MDY5713663.1 helix-turn-helix transcriptional regulator [Fusobacterium gastrosuis]
MLKSNLAYTMLDHKIKSVAELSRRVDISRETLRKIYNGERLETVSFETVMKLCEFFNCKIEDIIEYVHEEKNSEEQS